MEAAWGHHQLLPLPTANSVSMFGSGLELVLLHVGSQAPAPSIANTTKTLAEDGGDKFDPFRQEEKRGSTEGLQHSLSTAAVFLSVCFHQICRVNQAHIDSLPLI